MDWHWKIFPLGIRSGNVLSRHQWHHKFQGLPCCCQGHTKAIWNPMNPQSCTEENSRCKCKRTDVCENQHRRQTQPAVCRSPNCTPGSIPKSLGTNEIYRKDTVWLKHIGVANISSAERIGWFLNQSESRWASQNICKAWRQIMNAKKT